MEHSSHAFANGDALVATQRYQSFEASMLKSFLSKTEYTPLDISDTNEKLEQALRVEMETRNLACEQLERTLQLCASFAEVAYNLCSFSEKKNIALFTWYFMYVDDIAPKDPLPFTAFQGRFLRGLPQLHPILDAIVELLLQMWEQYDPLCANFIIDAAFEFVSSTCVESRLESVPLIRGAQRFPWFVRHSTGVGPSFALMIFPKSAKFDIMDVIQALPDMDYWICMWNDILSFHKEELAGEKSNYVHNRAYVDGKSPYQALVEMADESIAARNTIHEALAHNPDALKSWQSFERGYIQWHLTVERYRLEDLELRN